MKFKYYEPSIALDVSRCPDSVIRQAILDAGVRKVAGVAGISKTAVSQWASGKSYLPWSTAMKITDAVDKSEWLWTDTTWERLDACAQLGFDYMASFGVCSGRINGRPGDPVKPPRPTKPYRLDSMKGLPHGR